MALPRSDAQMRIATPPWWDIPARMIVAAGLVLGLSSAAPLTGPYLAGLFATFPVFATVLTIFAHRLEGEPAARQVLRGLLLGLFGFAGFFALLACALQTIGVAAAFTAAASTAVGIQGCSLRVVQRSA
jgi:drug/metabolite transporter (DMT)-like permease